MNQQSLSMIWDHLRQMNGITVRLIANLPADQLDSHPIPKMRTPKELLVHLYGTAIQGIAVGVTTGEIVEADEAGIVASLKTKDDVVRYCSECWSAADRAVTTLTEAQLGADVKTPWGRTMKGSFCIQVVRDEMTHHRGQLFSYVRALGQDVPMMWDFEHNAPEFQPKAHATT